MYRIYFLLILFCGSATFANQAYSQYYSTYQTAMQNGNDALDSGKYVQAINFFQTAVSKANSSAEAYNSLAYAYQMAGNRIQALVNYKVALSKNPKLIIAYANRAIFEIDSLGDYDAGLSDIKMALKDTKGEQLSDLLFQQARAYAFKGNIERAIKSLDECIENNPLLSEGYSYRGEIKWLKGLKTEAAKDFNHAISLQPNDFLGLYGLGMIAMDNKEYFLAESYFTKSLNAKPRLLMAIHARTNSYWFLKDFDSALKDARSLIELAPGDADSWFTLANVQGGRGEYNAAISAYQKGLQISPNTGIAYLALIELFARQEKFAEAVELYQEYNRRRLKTIIDDNKWTFVNFYLKVITENIPNGQWEAALNNISKAQALYTAEVSDKTLYTFQEGNAIKGYILTKLGRQTEAAIEYKKALFINGNQHDVILALRSLEGPERGQAPLAHQTNLPDIVAASEEKPVFHAILIAESEYADPRFNRLPRPLNDLKKFNEILTGRYGFKPENVNFLINPGRDELLTAIEKTCSSMNKNDNLLIYFAGHGYKLTNRFGQSESYWVPSKAEWQTTSTFVSRNEVISRLNLGDARHILVIADACFSGSDRDIGPGASGDKKVMYNRLSRTIMTSGRQKVPDESLLAYYLNTKLMENTQPFVNVRALFDSFQGMIINASQQSVTPEYRVIPGTGDDGGDFIFIKAGGK